MKIGDRRRQKLIARHRSELLRAPQISRQRALEVYRILHACPVLRRMNHLPHQSAAQPVLPAERVSRAEVIFLRLLCIPPERQPALIPLCGCRKLVTDFVCSFLNPAMFFHRISPCCVLCSPAESVSCHKPPCSFNFPQTVSSGSRPYSSASPRMLRARSSERKCGIILHSQFPSACPGVLMRASRPFTR